MKDYRGEARLALTGFPGDPLNQGRRLDQIARLAWEEFALEAEPLLRSADDSPLVRFLLLVYAHHGRLIPLLAKLLQGHRENGRKLIRLAMRLDPGLDRRLAQMILAPVKGEESAEPQTVLLEILAETERNEVILPVLGHFKESEDPRVRSKLAVLVGRAARAQAWIRVLKEDPDARVRANAIESLWEAGGAFAAVSFEIGLEDPNPRVAANAAIGLYRLGDARGVAKLAAMATHPEPGRRRSAVWAMGETRDGRFVPLLWRTRRTEEPGLAGLAAASCEKILLAQAAAERQAAEIYPLGTCRLADNRVVARAVVLDADRRPVVLHETDWRPKLGTQPAWRYSARVVEGLPRMAVAILLARPPRPADPDGAHLAQALREGLKMKRAADAVAIVHYRDSAAAASPGEDLRPEGARPVLLTADARMAVHAAIGAPQSATDLSLDGAAAACISALKQFQGARHLILLANAAAGGGGAAPQPWPWVRQAAESGIACHAILIDPGQDTSQGWRAPGFRIRIEHLEELQQALEALLAAMGQHYQLEIPEAPEAGEIELEIASQKYAAKARWPAGPCLRVDAAAADIHWVRDLSPSPESALAAPSSAGDASESLSL